MSDTLQLLWPVPVVDRVTCNAALGNNIPALLCIGPSSQVLLVVFVKLITDRTSFLQTGSSGCFGDSGGPVMVRTGEVWQLAGVIHAGTSLQVMDYQLLVLLSHEIDFD